MPITSNTGSLVKETTTTTGTGSYTLAGAATGFRAFSTAATAASEVYVPYVCKDYDGNFEIGIGELTTTTNLNRIEVIESSNANAEVDWAAGTKEIYLATSGKGCLVGKHLPSNTASPLKVIPKNDSDYDLSDGYAFGSMIATAIGDVSYDWGVWLCSHAQLGGLQDWLYLSPDISPVQTSAEDGTTTRYTVALGGASGVSRDSRGLGCVLVGEYSLIENDNAFVQGGHYNDGADYGEAMVSRWVGACRTADATPTEAGYYGDKFRVSEKQGCLFRISISAFDNATPNAKSWEVLAHLYRADAAAPVLVAAISKTVVSATAGTASWDVDADSDGVDSLSVTVTGAAATTVQWCALIEAIHAGGM